MKKSKRQRLTLIRPAIKANMMKNIFLYGLIFISCAVLAQKKDKHLPAGNEKFEQKQYAEAEAEYRVSQSGSPGNAASTYNLANSIYLQKQTAEARNVYLKATKEAKTRSDKHKAFHNLGNTMMKAKDYTAAVAAYKNALINNPADEESRYNYALAKQYLKDNPPPKDNKKNDKDKKKEDKNEKDKDKDKKNPKDDKGEQDKKNNEPKDDKGKDPTQNKDGDKPKAPPPPKDGASKQRIQNLLDAVNNEEKKVQDKINANKVKGRPVSTEKDW